MARWINDDTYGTLKLEAQIHPYVQDHSPAVLRLLNLWEVWTLLFLALQCSTFQGWEMTRESCSHFPASSVHYSLSEFFEQHCKQKFYQLDPQMCVVRGLTAHFLCGQRGIPDLFPETMAERRTDLLPTSTDSHTTSEMLVSEIACCLLVPVYFPNLKPSLVYDPISDAGSQCRGKREGKAKY